MVRILENWNYPILSIIRDFLNKRRGVAEPTEEEPFIIEPIPPTPPPKLLWSTVVDARSITGNPPNLNVVEYGVDKNSLPFRFNVPGCIQWSEGYWKGTFKFSQSVRSKCNETFFIDSAFISQAKRQDIRARFKLVKIM